jgi:hypothetical protein
MWHGKQLGSANGSIRRPADVGAVVTFGFRSAAGRNRECRGPDHARSLMLHQLSHSSWDFLDGPRVDLQIRRQEWHGVLDLEHRALNAARHRDGDGYLQLRKHQQPHSDQLTSYGNRYLHEQEQSRGSGGLQLLLACTSSISPEPQHRIKCTDRRAVQGTVIAFTVSLPAASIVRSSRAPTFSTPRRTYQRSVGRRRRPCESAAQTSPRPSASRAARSVGSLSPAAGPCRSTQQSPGAGPVGLSGASGSPGSSEVIATVSPRTAANGFTRTASGRSRLGTSKCWLRWHLIEVGYSAKGTRLASPLTSSSMMAASEVSNAAW